MIFSLSLLPAAVGLLDAFVLGWGLRVSGHVLDDQCQGNKARLGSRLRASHVGRSHFRKVIPRSAIQRRAFLTVLHFRHGIGMARAYPALQNLVDSLVADSEPVDAARLFIRLVYVLKGKDFVRIPSDLVIEPAIGTLGIG